MNQDDAVRLHDRATRGESLSAEERTRLDQWYASQDQAESRILAQGSEPPTLASLRIQVDGALARLSVATERIQKLNAENEAVRQEIANLQRRLAQKAPA